MIGGCALQTGESFPHFPVQGATKGCVQGVVDMINFWQNSVNWLNYLPFLTLAFCVVNQPCQQNMLRSA